MCLCIRSAVCSALFFLFPEFRRRVCGARWDETRRKKPSSPKTEPELLQIELHSLKKRNRRQHTLNTTGFSFVFCSGENSGHGDMRVTIIFACTCFLTKDLQRCGCDIKVVEPYFELSTPTSSLELTVTTVSLLNGMQESS